MFRISRVFLVAALCLLALRAQSTRGVIVGRDRRIYLDVYPAMPGGQ